VFAKQRKKIHKKGCGTQMYLSKNCRPYVHNTPPKPIKQTNKQKKVLEPQHTTKTHPQKEKEKNQFFL
jgi:hypothetical protein